MNVAIITARGGSKRIPGKNIRNFFGKPMITWPIGEALKSGLFSQIVVSTDSHEIAEVARQYGAVTPFMRPPELSDDITPTAPVLAHALKTLSEMGSSYKYACCIYPTSPFMQSDDLKSAFNLLAESKAPMVYSVTSFPFPILRAVKMQEDGSVVFNWPEHEITRSQDLPEFYHDAGQFYWFDTDTFLQKPTLMPKGTRPYILPRWRVQDLDTMEDWKNAELMAKILLQEKGKNE